MKIYIGWDARDELAFRACVSSLINHSSIDLDIIPLKDHELRRAGAYFRSYFCDYTGQKQDYRDGKPFSTDFSFTRFAVPLLDKGSEPVLFCDPDMLWLGDIAKLLAEADLSKAVSCVQHDYRPKEESKFDGMKQEHYFRKNWSSLMLMVPSKCTITPYMVNNQTGSFLHGMLWQDDSTIGSLQQSWNWLEGWSSPDITPDVVHFTRGTPDMLGDGLPYSKEWWAAVDEWRPEMNRNGLCIK